MHFESIHTLLNILNFVPQPISEIPYHQVEKKGVSYYLHGVVHGVTKSISKKSRASEELCKLIEQSAANYVSSTSDYMFEEGFDKVFNLKPSKSLDDVSYVTKTMPALTLKALFTVTYMSIRVGIFGIPRSKNGKTGNLNLDFSTLSQKALEDPRYLSLLSDFYLEWMELPQPLDLQLNSASTEFNQMNVIRSAYMAKKAEKKARSKKLDEMHLFLGLGHLSQVEYFLKGNTTMKIGSRKLG